jgi:hypothetical protein
MLVALVFVSQFKLVPPKRWFTANEIRSKAISLYSFIVGYISFNWATSDSWCVCSLSVHTVLVIEKIQN